MNALVLLLWGTHTGHPELLMSQVNTALLSGVML